ncbi:MAG: SEC-C metal-binding domain-containing protein, partial [Patescibacteria group bacterium]
LIANIQKQVVYNIYKMADVYAIAPTALKRTAPQQQLHGAKKDNTTEPAVLSTKDRSADGTKIGRNDPCHCGSGKKYKKCHGK